MNFNRTPGSIALLTSMWLVACGGDDDPKPQTPLEAIDIVDVDASPISPTLVRSEQACALDSDCKSGLFCFQSVCAFECEDNQGCDSGQSCSPRGQCLTEAGDQVVQEALPSYKIVNTIERSYLIKPGQKFLELELELDKAPPSEGLAYRIAREDDAGSGKRVRRIKGQGNKLKFSIPVGDASPESASPSEVRVDLLSALGHITIALKPEPSIAGEYAGTARVALFGSTGLPLKFEIITEPEGVALSQATKAWMVLPVAEERVFSPTRGQGTPDEVSAELILDDFTKTWVATFDSSFAQGQENILNAAQADQIGRALRFEFQEITPQEVFGVFRDRWIGLYDERSADGVLSPASVNFEGTFSAQRIGDARGADKVPNNDGLVAASPQAQPTPALDSCAQVSFQVPDVIDGAQTYSCAGVADVTAFGAANAQAQSSCAIALSKAALNGDTTTKQIQVYLEGGQSMPGGKSFSDYMVDCAAGTQGTCRPSAEVLCARNLLSNAYRTIEKDSPLSEPLLKTYTEVTREAFVGRQFGAYQTDITTRLTWLKTTEYPAVVTSLVRDLNERLLNEWRDNVLKVHFEVLRGQFDTAGLIVLARAPQSQGAQEARQELLMEMSQSFRTALDSLTLATTRWDALFVEASKRREKADEVATLTRDLYLIAGVLRDLNRASGVGALSAGFGAGFASLSSRLGQLSLGFNKLLYARDAEVIISTSVDPTVTNQTLLNNLEKTATDEITAAAGSISQVVSESQAKALSETELRNRLNNDINDLRTELVQLCGIAQGCSIADLDTRPECLPSVVAGECGFAFKAPLNESYDKGKAKFNEKLLPLANASVATSEAGRAVLSMMEAAQGVQLARQDLRAQAERTSLLGANTQAFANKTLQWQEDRAQNLTQLEGVIQKIIDSGVREYDGLVERIESRRTIQADALEKKRESIQKWNEITLGNAISDMAAESLYNSAMFIATEVLPGVKGKLETARDAELSAIPTESQDPYSALRASINLRYGATITTLETSAQATAKTAEVAKLAYDRYTVFRDINLERLSKESELKGLEREEDFEQLQEEYEKLVSTESGVRDELRDAMVLIRQQHELHMASERDVQELDDRRFELAKEITKRRGLELRVAQARHQILQRSMDYYQVVQRGQLVASKLDTLERQRQEINLILGSPAAVFAQANKVTQAEQRLERAKARLMDWLVALEYYAVRPFMDQRIQILLARNAYQLEEIAKKLKELQNNCGGSVNTQSSELSLRDELLGLTQDSLDEVEGVTLTPVTQLRAIMTEGYIPIDRRVRYSTDESVGQLVSRPGEVMAVSFDLDLNNFANLETTCNAKIKSVSIQLVGDVGEGRPTVSVLYDGTGLLRSCQPEIDAYVDQIGQELTSFGSITRLRSKGRSISPVAGVNVFAGEGNTSLGGLPLASQYTILIDKSAGENSKFDWTKLEDVRLKVDYTYQDLFPEGRCE